MKNYTVSLTINLEAKNPLEAAKEMANLYGNEQSMDLIYDVIDEETNESYTVDLSEEDEDAVLPN